MPQSNPSYQSFNAGELSDFLRGRIDLEQYYKGGLEFKNLLALPYGPTLMRPGSTYVANTKSDGAARLLRFSFNPTDSNIIEFGNLYFRFYTDSGQVAGPYEVVHTYTSAELFDVHYAQSNDVISLAHESHAPAKLTRVSAGSWNLADYDFVGTPYLDDNTTATTLALPSTTGTGLTMTASTSIFTANHVGSFWKIGTATGTPELQGFVKVTGYTSGTQVTVDVIDDLSTAGPTDDWAEGAWSDERGWPSRVCYHQNRLWFARTPAEPNGIWGSKPFIYDNFNPGTGLDDDAISEKVPNCSDIRFILGDASVIVGTDKGDFASNSGDTAALTPTTISFDKQTGWESEDIQPPVIGSYPYSVQGKARKLRELSYSYEIDKLSSQDTTALAEHITKKKIIDLAYQTNPYSILYCVLSDGTMACMTREAVQQVLAWTTGDTDGEYESVAAIPHPTENYDMVWAIVKRSINGSDERHVEYFENPEIPDRQDLCWYVDDGLRYNAYDQTSGISLTLSAVTGTSITITAGSSHFAADDVGQRIRAINVTTGALLGELLITGYTSGTQVTGNVTLDFDSLTYAGDDWGVSVNTVSGFGHLEAKSLKIFVDGGEHSDLTVSSGDITLATNEDGFVVLGGLGYTGRWKNMPLETGAAKGAAQTQKKRIYKAGFTFYRSLGMKAGEDPDNLDLIITRSPDTFMGVVEAYYTGNWPNMSLNTTWGTEGHMVIQQDKPFPMCIISVVPHVETNEQ